MMHRRTFINALAGGHVIVWSAAEAQQAAKVARIGYLGENPAASPHLREAFRQGLRDLGYVEGRNVVIEYRNADGKPERLPALAPEMVALKVDVIFAAGATRSARAAKEATRTVPIVFAAAGDPVGSGLVTRLARPGGNVTAWWPRLFRNLAEAVAKLDVVRVESAASSMGKRVPRGIRFTSDSGSGR